MRLLTDILYDNLETYSRKRALAIKPRYRTITWTYQELFEFAQGVGSFLEEKGLGKGDRAILWASNSPYWLGVFFGCLLRGVIVVPLHTENTPEFIQKVIAQTEPKIFFKSSDLKIEGEDWVDIDYIEEDGRVYPPRSFSEISEDDIVEILYTSGTTGEPKGVVLAHKNIVSNLKSIRDLIDVDKKDRLLSILPLSHIFEQIVEFRALAAGAFIVYAPALSSRVIKKILAEYHVNKMAAVPEFLKRVITRVETEAEKRGSLWVLSTLFALAGFIPQRSIRRLIFFNIHGQFGGKLDLIVSGGAALDAKTAKKWRALGVRVVQGYGLTETSPVLSALTPSDAKIESVGKVVPGVEVKIADDGEILARGPNITRGYWKNPEKTKELFTEDGWLRTGDLGFLDKTGRLHIRGRKKFMILGPSGQNVYPEDIEAELNKEPEVQDSAVVGIEKEGSLLIHAELLSRAEGGLIENSEAIITRVNKRLSGFQRVQSWSVWPFEDFPRTITRKVRRHKVLDYLKEKEMPAQMRKHEGAVSPLARLLGSILNKPANAFAKDTRIVSAGLDSLARIELVARLEEEFGAQVDEARITPATSVADLERLIDEKSVFKVKYKLRAWPRHGITKCIREVLFWVLVRPFFGIFADLRVEGLKNFQNVRGPVIFMPNHISDLDGAILHLALPGRMRRKIALAAATDVLFEKFWYFQPIITFLFNVYPFPRKGQTRFGFEYTGKLIDKGWSIVMFPEGRIPTDPEDRLRIKEGAGLAAVEMRVPVVPVKIEGADIIMPRGAHIPKRRAKMKVFFGKPLYFNRETSHKEATSRIHEALKGLG